MEKYKLLFFYAFWQELFHIQQQQSYLNELQAQRDLRRTKAEREAAQRMADEKYQNDLANQYNKKYGDVTAGEKQKD